VAKLLGPFVAVSAIIEHVDGVRLCLRIAATSGPIVHSPGDK
jgi:hypothetical protein